MMVCCCIFVNCWVCGLMSSCKCKMGGVLLLLFVVCCVVVVFCYGDGGWLRFCYCLMWNLICWFCVCLLVVLFGVIG